MIKAVCPAAPLTLIDRQAGVWELSGDLVLQNGGTLILHGVEAPEPGDVNTLRLISRASGLQTQVSQLAANYGILDIDSVAVTSWDPAAGGPDVDPTVPRNVDGARGRAFIRAVSYLDSDGTPRESTMRIVRSDVGHLGYYSAESYGVSYKARGCDRNAIAMCEKVKVYGDEIGSRFHHNYIGTYTWGAYEMHFLNNEYDNNVMYGLDPHDVSRYLTIEANHAHHNGDHGIICSQRCDHLQIVNNESDHNGMVPWAGPEGDSDAGMVDGIMIHRGVTNTVISGNNVHDHANGVGIAIFDSEGNSVIRNVLVRNQYGVRLSVGAARNTISDNTITDTGVSAVFMYRGTDPPGYVGASGRPADNVITRNTINRTGNNVAKIKESDGTVFSDNTVLSGGSFYTSESMGTFLIGNAFRAGEKYIVKGTTRYAGSMTIESPQSPLVVSTDEYSTCDITSAAGQIYTASTATSTMATPTGGKLHLASTSPGVTDSSIALQAIGIVPSEGRLVVTVSRPGEPQVTIEGQTPGVSVSFAVGGLSSAARYVVRRDGEPVITVVTDGSGVARFVDAPPRHESTAYVVAAA